MKSGCDDSGECTEHGLFECCARCDHHGAADAAASATDFTVQSVGLGCALWIGWQQLLVLHDH